MRKRKRLTPQAYRLVFGLLKHTQHGKCQLCPNPMTEIDHIDGNPENNQAQNLRGLCKSCNVRQRNLAKSADSVRMREGEKTIESESSLEVQINVDLFPRYEEWIGERIMRGNGVLTTREAIHGGAMWLRKSFGHGSSVTTRRWLGDLTSPQGKFELFEIKEVGRCIRFRRISC